MAVRLINEDYYFSSPIDNFMDDQIKSASLDDLIENRKLVKKLLDKYSRRYGRYSNDEDERYMIKYRRYLNRLDDAIKNARDKVSSNYELKQQIEKDIRSLIKRTSYGLKIDQDDLKELSSKYKDNRNIFYSVRRKVLNDIYRSGD